MSDSPILPRVGDTLTAEQRNSVDSLLADHHALRACLKPDHVPFDAPIRTGLERYGRGPVFALWLECRRVDRVCIAFTGKPFAEVVQFVPDELPQPDEAPGLTVEKPEESSGADRQQRLSRAQGEA